MAGCIRFPVADVAVKFRGRACGNELHETEPVGDRSPHVFRSLDIAVNDDRENSPREMPRIVPPFEFDCLGFPGVLAMGSGRVGIAAVGAYQPVHHQLQWRGNAVPVDRSDDHDPVGGDPHGIDFVHPVLGLAHCVIGVARARPMAERSGGREAGLAGMNVAAIFRRQPRQVEHIDFELPFILDRLAGKVGQPVTFGHFTRTGVFAPRRSVDQQNARSGCFVHVALLGGGDGVPGGQPIHRKVIVLVRELRPGLSRQRTFTGVRIGLPRHFADLADGIAMGLEGGIPELLAIAGFEFPLVQFRTGHSLPGFWGGPGCSGRNFRHAISFIGFDKMILRGIRFHHTPVIAIVHLPARPVARWQSPGNHQTANFITRVLCFGSQ